MGCAFYFVNNKKNMTIKIILVLVINMNLNMLFVFLRCHHSDFYLGRRTLLIQTNNKQNKTDGTLIQFLADNFTFLTVLVVVGLLVILITIILLSEDTNKTVHPLLSDETECNK